MTISIEQLRALVDGIGVRYFLDPHRDALMFTVRGERDPYQVLVLSDLEGRFLQFRSIGFLHCPATHAHVGLVHRVLAEVNLEQRLVKHAWEPGSGEIVAMADLWAMDNTVTAAQFRRMLENFIGGMDGSQPRLVQALATGRDPGAAGSAAPPVPAGVTDL